MLNVDSVSKTFSSGFFGKKTIALQSLSFYIKTGEVYAFLGPNGAGKTTTIKSILGIIKPDSGEISINNIDYRNRKARREIGYLPDQPYFYDDLTAIEYLYFAGKLHGLATIIIKKKSGELLETMGLRDHGKQHLRHFSRGMLQRLGMAQALIHDPKLLIFDEPMTGLDPIGRKDFREQILSLKARGKTIFFSSHILADAEMIADRVGILHHGRLVREMSLHELQSEKNEGMELSFHCSPGSTIKGTDIPWSNELFDHSGVIHLPDENSIFKAIEWVKDNGGSIYSLSPKRKTLEDIFLEEMKS